MVFPEIEGMLLIPVRTELVEVIKNPSTGSGRTDRVYCIVPKFKHLSAKLRAMKKENIAPFFATLKAANPMPVTELEYTSVFELLTAVLLSAQATDVGVNKATRRLFPVANTPAKILALGLEGLETYIKTIGLYHSKAKHLLQTCQMLVERHNSVVPRDRAALEALPGVGRKTANVVLNSAFGEATMAVDTHIFRMGNRTGLAPGKTPLEVELKLLKRIPAEYLVDAHHWLILHGRYVCIARSPQCGACMVSKYCTFTDKNLGI
jgi:endonuclease III